jgi:UDP-N-acetylglucosamine acyltransferase
MNYPGNDIDPTAIIYPGVEMGTGNIIGPFCIIGAPPEWRDKEYNRGRVVIGDNNRFTGLVTIDSGGEHNTQIGSNCYFMKHSYVAHDAVISNNVTLSSGAKVGGHTIIGEHTTLGLNAVIHQKVCVPYGCMIGMGAVVTKKTNMVGAKKYAGNPAKLIGDNDQHLPTYLINRKQFPGE